jgi:hypothetical protein
MKPAGDTSGPWGGCGNTGFLFLIGNFYMQSAARSRVVMVKTSAALPPKFRSNSWFIVWPGVLFHRRCILYLEKMFVFTRQQTRLGWRQNNRIPYTNHTQWARGLHMILKLIFLNSLRNIWQSVVYQKYLIYKIICIDIKWCSCPTVLC